MPDAKVPTPQELYDGIRAGWLAEKKRLHEAEAVAAESRDRIKKAERMLTMLAAAFKIREPDQLSIAVTPPDRCGRKFQYNRGLARHRSATGHDMITVGR